MKIIFKLNVCVSIFFIFSFISCSTVKTSSVSNKLEINASPQPTPSVSQQNYEARFIRQEGYKIPFPEKKRKTRVIEREVMSENGKKVKRTIILFASGDFLFQRESGTSNSGIEIPSEMLKLKGIWELKIKDKIYSYTITAHNATPNKLIDHEHDFIYRYFDMDGDGKFEMLVTDDSEVLVPEWATQ
jgi:hypothetical protein